MSQKSANPCRIEDVFEAAGGAQVLARKLGLARTSIYGWRRVPAHWCIRVEKETGISREILRPDVFLESKS